MLRLLKELFHITHTLHKASTEFKQDPRGFLKQTFEILWIMIIGIFVIGIIVGFLVFFNNGVYFVSDTFFNHRELGVSALIMVFVSLVALVILIKILLKIRKFIKFLRR